MKELSNEEKAKRYDEAIERATKWYDANTNEGYRGIFEDIFPELKENEDERIRKAIEYAICQSTHSDGTLINGVSSEESLAWLEKKQRI